MKQVMKGFRFLILILIFGAFTVGCASSDGKKRGEVYITTPREPANYRPHPGAYLTDRFQVERPVPKSEPSPLPFFFKQCTRDVGNYFGTNTRYDCD